MVAFLFVWFAALLLFAVVGLIKLYRNLRGSEPVTGRVSGVEKTPWLDSGVERERFTVTVAYRVGGTSHSVKDQWLEGRDPALGDEVPLQVRTLDPGRPVLRPKTLLWTCLALGTVGAVGVFFTARSIFFS